MKSPTHYIVKPVDGRRYANTKDIGGLDLIISTSEEDHRFSNRYAEVIETSVDNPANLSKGDIIIVHHNVFKFYNDMKGRRRSGMSFFRDDLFLVDTEQFFAYKRDNQWHSWSKYSFVSPIPMRETTVTRNDKYEPLVGRVEIPSQYLVSKGVSKGDLVMFAPETEYEFTIDGKLMYRIIDRHITTLLNGLEENTNGDNQSG